MKNEQLDTKPQVKAAMNRLKEFLNYLQTSMHKFGETANIAAGGISRAMNSEGTYNMGIDKFMNIFTVYPQLNPMWLLFGEGTMLKEDIPKGAPSHAELQEKHTALQKDFATLEAKADVYREILSMLGQSLKRPVD